MHVLFAKYNICEILKLHRMHCSRVYWRIVPLQTLHTTSTTPILINAAHIPSPPYNFFPGLHLFAFLALAAARASFAPAAAATEVFASAALAVYGLGMLVVVL